MVLIISKIFKTNLKRPEIPEKLETRCIYFKTAPPPKTKNERQKAIFARSMVPANSSDTRVYKRNEQSARSGYLASERTDGGKETVGACVYLGSSERHAHAHCRNLHARSWRRASGESSGPDIGGPEQSARPSARPCNAYIYFLPSPPLSVLSFSFAPSARSPRA